MGYTSVERYALIYKLLGALVLLMLLGASHVLAQQRIPQQNPARAFTLDFEEGTLRGWTPTGRAFANQPTYGDNPTARGRGQPANQQGNYWIGTFENYQGRRGQEAGAYRGDAPTGTLTSAPFLIPEGTLTFRIGGGSGFETRVELLVLDPIEGSIRMAFASGRNSETMQPVTWDLTPHAGQTGQLRLVDEAAGSWGHLNVDHFVFSAFSEPRIDPGIIPGELIRPDPDRPPAVTPTPQPMPVALVLQATPTVIPSGGRVQLEALVEGNVEGLSYRFHFGDGAVRDWDASRTVYHVYEAPGIYAAFVEVGMRGQVLQASERVEVSAYGITLVANPPEAVVGDAVVFEGGVEPPRPGVRYELTFGDGEATQPTATAAVRYVYQQPGTYRAQLRAFLADMQLVSRPVTVTVSPSQLLLVQEGAAQIGTDEGTWFRVQQQPFRPNYAYRVQFGDGTASPWSPEPAVVHSFRTPGRYPVVAEARSPDGRITLTSNELQVEVVAISLLTDTDVIQAGRAVTFTAALAPANTDLAYRFHFGDGQTALATNATQRHVYDQAGTFEAFVTAERQGVVVAQSTPTSITVGLTPYVVRLVAHADSVTTGQAVHFSGRIAPNLEGVAYQYDFGDAITRTPTREATADHAFQRAGTYDVVLTAIVGDREISSEPVRITVWPRFAVALRATPAEVRRDAPVTFEVSGVPTDVPVEVNIHFGDGGSTGWSTSMRAVHAYAEAGRYEAFAEVRGPQGAVLERVVVPVTIQGFPWWIPLVVGTVLLVAAASYFVGRRMARKEPPPKPPPAHLRPVFEPHPDPGTQTLAPGSRLTRGIEVHLRPVQDPGTQQLVAPDDLRIQEPEDHEPTVL